MGYAYIWDKYGPMIHNYDVNIDLFREIKELISALIEDGHLKKHPLTPDPDDKLGVMEEEFLGKLQAISTKYYSMTEEELEFIDNLYNKYR